MTEKSATFDTSILKDERFLKLNKSRSRMVGVLSLGLFFLYVANMLMMSVFTDIAAIPVVYSTVINVGMAFSVGVVFLGIVIAAFYAWWANRFLDQKRVSLLESVNGKRVYEQSSSTNIQ